MNDLQMTNQDLSQRQSMEELANQLTLADHLVYKNICRNCRVIRWWSHRKK